tara:strand:- start:18 stop:131 length:114 start_codon:yes stop_codon:yes gene_type:complete
MAKHQQGGVSIPTLILMTSAGPKPKRLLRDLTILSVK